MQTIKGLELPFGIKPVEATPVDAWSGPFTSTEDALISVPIEIRYITMQIRIIDGAAGGKMYWFKDGITDNDLVPMGDMELSQELSGETANRISGDTALYNLLTGETESRILEDIRLNNLITGSTNAALYDQLTGETQDRVLEDIRLNNLITGSTNAALYDQLTGETQDRVLEDIRLNALITGETVDRITGQTANYNIITGLSETVADNYAAFTDHTHDDRYFTETETNTLLLSKSETGHTHTQYVEKITGKSLIDDVQITKLVLYPTLETGNTTEFLRGDGQLVAVSLSEMLSKTEAATTYSPTGHTHLQYLTGYTETEPAYNASVAKNITTGDTFNWNSKQEALESGVSIKTINNQSLLGSGNLTITGITFDELDPLFAASPAFNITTGDTTNWDDAFGWGDHADAGYLTGETEPAYNADKASIALKTDLTNFITGFTENDPIYESEKHLYITGETDPIYQNEKSTLALKTDLSNYVPSTGGTISGNVTIAGDLIVTGSTYETDVQSLNVADAYIKLRNGAIGGLATGEYTGIEAVKYDGTNSGRLVFDNTGVARVGDVGSEQPLATREETPTDNGIAVWDNIASQFETTTLKLGDVSLTGHTHSQYLTGFTESDPVYEAEKYLYSLTGHTHDDRYFTETETNNLLLTKSGTGHTHSQYLTGETEPAYNADKASIALKTDLTNFITGFTESDPVYEAEKHVYSQTGHTHTTEYDLRYVNTTGDTMTGPLTINSPVTGATVLSINGVGGEIFSITDSEVGNLFDITDVSGNTVFEIVELGDVAIRENLIAAQFIKSGGTSSQFLKADGSSDANVYSVVSHIHSQYLNLSGGTITGNVTVATLAGSGNRAVYSDANGVLTNSSSDRILKKNIEDITYGTETLMKLRPVSYNWKDDNRGTQTELGFIANEVQLIIPELIGINNDETLSLDYPKLTSVLVKAIQELVARIEILESKINV